MFTVTYAASSRDDEMDPMWRWWQMESYLVRVCEEGLHGSQVLSEDPSIHATEGAPNQSAVPAAMVTEPQ